MIGTKGDSADDQWGTRQDYLALPYNDPRRQAFRGLEAQLGAMFRADNDARDAGGLITGSLAGFLAIAGAAGAGAFVALSGGAIPQAVVAMIMGAAAGATTGTILGAAIDVRVRPLTVSEWSAVRAVFGDSLPAREKIILSDLSGLGGREFTIPASSLALVGAILNPALLLTLTRNPQIFQGMILVNMGPQGFKDPLGYTRGTSYTKPGQVLMHELTHAWQIGVSTFVPGVICQGLYNQASNTLGADVYGVTDGGQWRDYNLEQQGAIVDHWYFDGMSTTHKYYRYIKANILACSNNAESFPLGRAATVTSPLKTAKTVRPSIPLATTATVGPRFVGGAAPTFPLATTATEESRFVYRIP